MTRLPLSPSDRELLEGWVSSADTPARLELRARVVLALADGQAEREVSRNLEVARQTVALWRRRVLEHGSVQTLLADAPGRGRKPSVPETTRSLVYRTWLDGQEQGTPRSVRDLAKQFGLSPATVHRTLKAYGSAAPEQPVVLVAPSLSQEAESA